MGGNTTDSITSDLVDKLDGGIIDKLDVWEGVRAFPLRVKWSFNAYNIRAFPESVSTESGASMLPTEACLGRIWFRRLNP
jgi:hypothetical protein